MESVEVKFNGQSIKLRLRDEADISVMREIFKLREYRAAEETIKSAEGAIIDAGAHAGFFMLYCHALNPQAKIYAIEPEKNNLSAFKENLAANKVKGVKLVVGALAGKSGKRALVVSSNSHNHHLGDEAGETAAYSFADFCKREKIKTVALLKMDIEGGEREVLNALTSNDFAAIKNMILEYHESSGEESAEMLRANGFSAQIFPSKFDKTMGIIFARNKR